MGQFVEADDALKGTMTGDDALGSTADEGLPASVKAPEVRTTEDHDFISNKSLEDQSANASLNPRFSGNKDKKPQSNVAAVRNGMHVPLIIF